MATKAPKGGTAVNNYNTSGPVQNMGGAQAGNGGNVKITRIAAAATHAGHSQCNPGSKVQGSPNASPGGHGYVPVTKHAADSTMLGKNETAND